MKPLNEYAAGDFLKAINVTSENEAFAVTEVTEIKRNEKDELRITVQKEGHDYDFDLNKTNIAFLLKAGVNHPHELIGRKLFFRKALVRNPKTNLEVEGLRICKLE